MNKKFKKYALIVVAIIVIAVIVFFIIPGSKQQNIVLVTSKVEKGSISTSVTATGTVEPITLVEVGTQVSGVISKIYVDFNSVVKKGEKLAELDTRLLNSELETAQANLETKQVEFENQKLNYNRQKELWQKKAISQSDWESAELSYKTAKLAVTTSQAAVLKARTNLGYATISSTIDGVVISRAVEEGQTVAASFSTPTLFTIANDLTKMRVIANVDEADIGEVQEGQRVTFTVDAYPNDQFTGKVVQVRLEATTTSNVVTYEVVIEAPNPDLKLKPGLTASVNIFTMEQNDVLLIPSKSLRFTPDASVLKSIKDLTIEKATGTDSNQKTVWVKSGNKLSPKTVTLGTTDGINYVVTSGLNEGEEVTTGVAQKSEVVEDSTSSSTETSPFMPKRPGNNSTKKSN